MDKSKEKSKKNKQNVYKTQKTNSDSSYNEEYGYDFVPNLNKWLNIDDQDKITKRLENIEKD